MTDLGGRFLHRLETLQLARLMPVGHGCPHA